MCICNHNFFFFMIKANLLIGMSMIYFGEYGLLDNAVNIPQLKARVNISLGYMIYCYFAVTRKTNRSFFSLE